MSTRANVGEQIDCTGWYYFEACCECGIGFGLDTAFRTARLRDGKYFYCPAGHMQHYTETIERRVRRELETVQHQRDVQAARAKELDETVQARNRQLSATRGVVTKYRRRVGRGACPCCKRFFPNLAAHMGSQHPDFAGSTETKMP